MDLRTSLKLLLILNKLKSVLFWNGFIEIPCVKNFNPASSLVIGSFYNTVLFSSSGQSVNFLFRAYILL
jgi:hypothetical protein